MSEVEYRKCYHCSNAKVLNSDNFNKCGKSGFHRYCKECRKITRKDGYKHMSDEEKKISSLKSIEYQKNTIEGRAMVMLKSYRTADRNKGREFNMTKQWLIDNIIDKPCFYCEDTYRTGCERLNNNLGHIIENCVPCCAVCNSVRSDIFTILEMKELGLKIKELKGKREIKKISGNSKKLKTIKFEQNEITFSNS